ncbi:uncharacterized protein PHACADRAFT_253909 [Phanerochaete carnosa HHB-10118-sp]|uniref:PCI domain-containing protein n=1 Tax=Phanerochaete carnosa (strain HHB-10118-sp) TaxID=650164 RepID=K5WBR8_PHACS|nr:uncharacterized protein PHACADRAFT_253909 [Phanerochaete carnosa HHB-10118-sp]EKM56660.1 hypothetical protein PHACADRAFT_253909 [Phanerochaete carnosa HHB-10118-sp]
MEMDIDEQQQTRRTGVMRVLPIDDNHPFDLDQYISNYTGRALVDRLTFLIPQCPTLAVQAAQVAAKHIRNMRDTSLYSHLSIAYEQAQTNASSDAPLPPFHEVVSIDQTWIEETNRKNADERTKLEVELKTYSSNMIKESIRMAHRDLAEFHRSVGDYQTALKHYAKLREFCTTSQHVLDMCIAVLELLIEQRNYTHIPTYVFKAEPALDASTNALRSSTHISASSAATPHAAATAAQASRDRLMSERQKTQTKLEVATGISHLGLASYEKAASAFVRVGSAASLGAWATKVIHPSDIAIYTTLCALATLQRSQIKSQIMENDTFVSSYLESEPYIRELVVNWLGGKFKAVLESLEKYSTRHALLPHLAPHLSSLMQLIRSRAVALYFRPFATVKLEKMAAAFGWTISQAECEVVRLIGEGDIKGRVDRLGKILRAQETDQRAELFARTMKAGQDMQSANRKLLLRLKLQQADLIVKAPKQSNQPQQGSQQPIQSAPSQSGIGGFAGKVPEIFTNILSMGSGD